MNTAEIHDRIQALKFDIRSIGKTLDDHRTGQGEPYLRPNRRHEDRRKDEITTRIFNNTVRYQTSRDFTREETEEFIEDIRSGKYG
jgi:hypothetical protein